jgi:hypothetical protein
VEEVLAAEAGAIFSSQLSRQRRDNLISVFRPGIAEDIAPYPAQPGNIGNSENVFPVE